MMKSALISELLKFRFGSKVFCSDGEYGLLDEVVVDAARRSLTHVGVSRGLFVKKRFYLAFSQVSQASSDGVTLTTRLATLEQEAVPEPQGIRLSGRSLVEAKAAHQHGTLLLLAVQPGSGEIAYLVAHNLPKGQDTLLRASAIAELTAGGVSLNISAEELAGLPPYRPDRELQREVEAVLFDLYPLHVDLRGISARVLDGVLYLDGNISSALRADLVERQVMGVPGLLEIRNNLVADDTLASQVALALGCDQRTRGLPIGVYPRLGAVRLSGAVRSAEQKRVAEEIARAVPGVRQVINELTVKSSAERLPVMASTGAEDEDLVPGGRYVRHTK
ncbi:BON domain-containing protein [Thermogemmatispora sp.]|uniref:BON domain-containing protein n=1 Tax=Thermogemmatispora sp. TaxID=1968838 RepID=UPI0035E401EE